MNHNPITKIVFNKQHGVNSERVDAAHDTATGKGNLSRTVTRSQVMCLNVGQFFGEEVLLADMSIVYNAVAESDTLRVLRIEAQSLK